MLDRLSLALGKKASMLVGGMSSKQKQVSLDNLVSSRTPVLLSQIRAGSLGINEMVAANVAIYISTGYSLEDFTQSRDRLHRDGQKRAVTYYHLQVPHSVDEKVYEDLNKDIVVARRVINLDYVARLLSAS